MFNDQQKNLNEQIQNEENENLNNDSEIKLNKFDFNVSILNFNGPFDLLFNLIKEKKMDILNINLEELIQQYVFYINQNLTILKIDTLTEYLLMATYLLEHKSKKILPALDTDEKIEKDIERDKFIQRLLIYKQYEKILPTLENRYEKRIKMFERASESIDKSVYFENPENLYFLPKMDLNKILEAMQKIYIKLKTVKQTKTKDNVKTLELLEVSIDDVQKDILNFLSPHPIMFKISFEQYFELIDPKKFTKQYFVVSFVAFLVLVRNQMILLEQNNEDDIIFIVKISNEVVNGD